MKTHSCQMFTHALFVYDLSSLCLLIYKTHISHKNPEKNTERKNHYGKQGLVLPKNSPNLES